ncbi:MAG: hypothetical protein ACOVP1_11110 [Bacteroidia bacterium]
MENKFCQNCGESIKGRIDKKFCDDACRSTYHHKKSPEQVSFMRNIHYILQKNRKILAKFFHKQPNQALIEKRSLLEMGFHFGYHTQTIQSDSNLPQFACYDYAYQELNENQILLIKIQSGLQTDWS